MTPNIENTQKPKARLAFPRRILHTLIGSYSDLPEHNPFWTESISRGVSTLILITTGVGYARYSIAIPIERFGPIALSALGIIAGLCAICLTYAQCEEVNSERRKDLIASAKNFLHCCLLLIQSLFVKFTYESVFAKFEFLKSIWASPILLVFCAIYLLLILQSVHFAVSAFRTINDALWNDYLGPSKIQIAALEAETNKLAAIEKANASHVKCPPTEVMGSE